MKLYMPFRAVFVGLLLVGAMLFYTPQASATDPQVKAAITQGVVGERADGYLGLVTGTAEPAVQRKVNEINVKRRALYERLARETGTTLEEVGYVTGEKQIAKTPSGAFYMNSSGDWVRK